MSSSQFPRFYDLDEYLIKVVENGEYVEGYTQFGVPYPPIKAMVEGVEITEEKYNFLRSRGVSKLD